MWTYHQSTGVLENDQGPVGTPCYAGRGKGVNNPDLQAVPNVGPLPCGVYTIGPPRDDVTMGPFIMPLLQVSGATFGRGGFYIHGDTYTMDHTASHGCIVAPRSTRQIVAQSGDNELTVVA